MAALITGLVGKLLLPVGILAAAGFAFLLVRHELDARAAAEAKVALQAQQLDQAVSINQANAKAIALLRADADRRIAEIARDRDAARKRAGRSATITKEIENAPPQDDGPVAPVLRRALDRLRGGL